MGKTIDLTKAAEAAAEAPVKKSKKAITDKKNASNLKNKIKKERDVMYRYPKECDTAEAKKKFRAAARKKQASYFKKLKKVDAAARPKLLANAQKFAKRVYTEGNRPEFA